MLAAPTSIARRIRAREEVCVRRGWIQEPTESLSVGATPDQPAESGNANATAAAECRGFSFDTDQLARLRDDQDPADDRELGLTTGARRYTETDADLILLRTRFRLEDVCAEGTPKEGHRRGSHMPPDP
jgi:hypothetical protein